MVARDVGARRRHQGRQREQFCWMNCETLDWLADSLDELG